VLPTVVYQVKSKDPKTVIIRYTGRFLSGSTRDDYPRVCITSEGLGRAEKYEKSGQADTLAAATSF
jgi:hypothetical protein